MSPSSAALRVYSHTPTLAAAAAAAIATATATADVSSSGGSHTALPHATSTRGLGAAILHYPLATSTSGGSSQRESRSSSKDVQPHAGLASAEPNRGPVKMKVSSHHLLRLQSTSSASAASTSAASTATSPLHSRHAAASCHASPPFWSSPAFSQQSSAASQALLPTQQWAMTSSSSSRSCGGSTAALPSGVVTSVVMSPVLRGMCCELAAVRASLEVRAQLLGGSSSSSSCMSGSNFSSLGGRGKAGGEATSQELIGRRFHQWYADISSRRSSRERQGGGGEREATDEAGEDVGTAAPDESTTVVLLGWLGAKQKHLRLYADWYNRQGLPALSFVLPLKDVISIKAGEAAELHVDSLVAEIERWLQQGGEVGSATEREAKQQKRQLVFHTFSNTGWLLYGAVLKRLHEKYGNSIDDIIKGCIVDSAPALQQDPQIWANGFSAAILKKRGNAASDSAAKEKQPEAAVPDGKVAATVSSDTAPTAAGLSSTESLINSLLKRFFSVYLQLPPVKAKLDEITHILAKRQPSCPQLYIYSSADDVIPAKEVESFVQLQISEGKRQIVAKNFESSPHVDHFRAFPQKYGQELSHFLSKCVRQ